MAEEFKQLWIQPQVPLLGGERWKSSQSPFSWQQDDCWMPCCGTGLIWARLPLVQLEPTNSFTLSLEEPKQ